MYDAIVVGGGCAGAAVSMLLARRGHRVLVLDEAAASADAEHVTLVQQSGVEQLRRWGLLEQLTQNGMPSLHTIRLNVGGASPLEGSPPAVGGAGFAGAPRRSALRAALLTEAARAGAEVRAGEIVDEIHFDGSRAHGVRGRSTGSARTFVERAQIVIGADGVWSTVAQQAGAPAYLETPALSWSMTSEWVGLEQDQGRMELFASDTRLVTLTPTPGRRTTVTVVAPLGLPAGLPQRVDHELRMSLDAFPALAARARVAERLGPIHTAASPPNFLRRPYGPGWVLVGDAGYHRDPVTAQGVADAFRDAEMTARAVDAGLCGKRSLYEGLASYHAARDAAIGSRYQATLQLASFRAFAAADVLGADRCDWDRTARAFGVPARCLAAPRSFADARIGARREVVAAGA